MSIFSSKFDSVSGTTKIAFRHSNVPTELITIGGTGGTKTGQKQFHRIHNKKDSNASQHGLILADRDILDHYNSDRRSADGLPLRKEKEDENRMG
jgi:hypothetical protein